LKIKKEIKIGVLIVIATGLLFWGLNYLKGNNPFVKERFFYALYDNVEGLNSSSKVTINGLKVGKVNTISINAIDSGLVIVKFSLDQEIQIPDLSIAEIYSLDLMGNKGIQLKFINSNTFYNIGDTVLSATEQDLKDQVSAQMLPLKLKAEDLMVSIEDAVKVVKDLFNKTNTDNIQGTLRNLNKTFKTLEHTSTELDSLLTNNRGRIDSIFINVNSITANLRNNNEQISFILKNLASVSDSLAKSKLLSTINNANRTLESVYNIMSKIERGEGTMGLLINNDSLYNNLNKSSQDLDKLLVDLRENPKRYLHYSLFDFGKTVVVDESGYDPKKEKKKKRKKKKDNNDDSSYNDVNYKIQIKSSLKSININSSEFKGLSNISEWHNSERYKYTVGIAFTMKEAKQLQNKVREVFPDAFVVAYNGKDQIDVKEAKKVLN
jgi:phospholipid/cholesterol/gamma-HCH transport system substrate-binding protein